MKPSTVLMWFFVASVIVISGAAGIWVGMIRTLGQTKETDVREERVIGWVVERNPQATIKDFQGFARMLIDESAGAGVDYRLTMAIIDKESQFNPWAVGRAGEIGLMQVMPATARMVVDATKMTDYVPPTVLKAGGYSDLGSLGDPLMNVRIGLSHLKGQVAKFGTTPTALRAYNRGDKNARTHMPLDRYAEDVAFRLVAIVQAIP
jgi:soluble lytic murein transglycosylase-like protein